jgi:hypothetical protein
LTGDRKINKNGLNNIVTTEKKISRNEASKLYQQLTPEAREEADDWINNRFVLATSFPKNVKLDPKNQEHEEFVEEWLKQRDIVMGWDIKWETTIGQNRVPNIFSENNNPTPRAKLERGEGIFEQRMTGSEFNKYLSSQLYEGYIYSNPVARQFAGRLNYEAKIAEKITNKLTGNELWFNNAVGSKEGRDALRRIVMLLPINSENKALRKKMETSLEPYRHEPLIKRAENISKFNEIYAQLEAHILKGLETEGYTVEKIYVKDFSNNSLEIRASVKKQVTLDNQTYGYRSDPYTDYVRTERKDINVGGFSYSSGAILNHSHFAKHGTAQTDWDTQLALGEVAVMAGIGIKSLVSGIGRIIVNRKVATKTLKELSEQVTERTFKVTNPALSDTIPISLADTIPLSKANTGSMLKRESLPKLKGTSETPTIKGMGEPSPTITLVKEKNSSVDVFGDTVIPKYEPPNPFNFPTKGVYNLEGSTHVPEGIAKELGEDLSMKLNSYGLSYTDISKRINVLRERGKTSVEIKNIVSDENKVFEYIRDTYHYPNQLGIRKKIALEENRLINANDRLQSLMQANRKTGAAINVAEGNISQAISGAEWWKLVKAADDPKSYIGQEKFMEISKLSDQKARDVLTKLGVSFGSVSFMYLGTKNQEKDTNQSKEMPKLKERENKVQKINKLREKGGLNQF